MLDVNHAHTRSIILSIQSHEIKKNPVVTGIEPTTYMDPDPDYFLAF